MQNQDFEDFKRLVLDGVRSVGAEFNHPDDDWAAVGFYKNSREIGMITIGQSFFADEKSKNSLVRYLVDTIRQRHATYFALVTSAWRVSMPRDQFDQGDWVRPSQHPDRQECVDVSLFGVNFYYHFEAAITRSLERPPLLGPWVGDEQHIVRASGRLIDPLRAAMALNADAN